MASSSCCPVRPRRTSVVTVSPRSLRRALTRVRYFFAPGLRRHDLPHERVEVPPLRQARKVGIVNDTREQQGQPKLIGEVLSERHCQFGGLRAVKGQDDAVIVPRIVIGRISLRSRFPVFGTRLRLSWRSSADRRQYLEAGAAIGATPPGGVDRGRTTPVQEGGEGLASRLATRVRTVAAPGMATRRELSGRKSSHLVQPGAYEAL